MANNKFSPRIESGNELAELARAIEDGSVRESNMHYIFVSYGESDRDQNRLCPLTNDANRMNIDGVHSQKSNRVRQSSSLANKWSATKRKLFCHPEKRTTEGDAFMFACACAHRTDHVSNIEIEIYFNLLFILAKIYYKCLRVTIHMQSLIVYRMSHLQCPLSRARVRQLAPICVARRTSHAAVNQRSSNAFLPLMDSDRADGHAHMPDACTTAKDQ